MMNRREFVGVSAAALGATRLLPLTRTNPVGQLDRIGVQLYTIRAAMERDFEGSLARVAKIGYRDVEFAGYFGHSARDVRTILDRHGLRAPAAHISTETIRGDWEQALADAQTIGHEYLVCAWINDADRTHEGYEAIANEFNRAANTALNSFVGFAYHNHVYEFKPLADGHVPYDSLLRDTDPSLVKFEIDLFWMIEARRDPLAYFAKYPGRFPLLHVKDRDAAGKMVDVGRGTIDFRTIFAHANAAGVRHVFVEHDEPADPFASIEASYRYLRDLRF